MITETAFVGAENLPQEMARSLDKPWTFVGEVRSNRSVVECLCECQRRPCLTPSHSRHTAMVLPAKMRITDLFGHDFITDDLLIVRVYFGVCVECGRVHWARQGPPFQRVRRMVEAVT